MSVSRIVLAAAFAAGLASSMNAAQAVEGSDCGTVLQDGKYVFLGTCPTESSDASEQGPSGGGSKDPV